MTALVGQASVFAGLAVAGVGFAASVAAARSPSPGRIRIARASAAVLLVLALTAAGSLLVALLRHDFSLLYVAQNGSRETPAFYTAISLWGALEGSILVWLAILAAYTAVVAWLVPRRAPELYPIAQAVLFVIGGFFLWLVAGPANPFQTISPAPLNGPGPNPLLQNHALMAVHPPALYIGLVGFSVPFAFAIAALVTGRLDATWIRVTRGATLVAWSFLGLGVVLGGWWSYEVLGWGGYFAWDPVENASLLPWLTATAFIHSVLVQEKREMLKLWNLTLVVATFLLTLLGTFLTRSGVLSSVHAFGSGLVGPSLLVFIGVALAVSLGLLVWRGELLRSDGLLDAPVCRESAFLLNNLLLVGLTLTVLVGTLFPLFVEAWNGTRLSVGEPYFNATGVPIGLALLFLMGLGPALPWRKASFGVVRRRLLAPVVFSLVLALVLLAAGVRKPAALAAVALGSFVIAQAFWDVGRLARRGSLTRNRRRIGGQIVHVGVALVAIGIAVSSSYQVEGQRTLSPGQTMRVGSTSIRFDGLTRTSEPRRDVLRASLLVDGRDRLEPALNLYRNQQNATASPAVRASPGTDVYAVLVQGSQNGSAATIRVFLNPLVTWLWFGAGVILVGAAVAAAPIGRFAA